jgi:hypothetical protein
MIGHTNTIAKRALIGLVLVGFLYGAFISTPTVLAVDQAQTTQSGQTQQNVGTPSLEGAGGCLISTLLANILTNALTSVMAAATAIFATPGDPEVPVQRKAADLQTFGVTIGGTYIPIIPGLDSIAYCLVNTIITYIADATIAWIRSGFEGNPVFVDNPELFFQSIADYELGNMLNQIAGGILCQPFNLQVRLALLQDATRGYGQQAKCTGEQAINNLKNSFSSADWIVATQNPANTPVGAYYASADALNARIGRRQNTFTLELGWNRGFLSFKDPKNPNRTITPGMVIEEQINKRLNLGEQRLVLQEKFDQVVTELVNALVKIALNELFEATGVQATVEPNYQAYYNYFGGQGQFQQNPTQPNRPLLPQNTSGYSSGSTNTSGIYNPNTPPAMPTGGSTAGSVQNPLLPPPR